MEPLCGNRVTISETKRQQYVQLLLLTGGIVLVTTGLLIATFLVPIYEFMLKDGLKFQEGSEAFNAWRNNEPPLDLDLYLFNWTNADELRSGGKPHFDEVGPYRVKEAKEKVDLVWNSNDTISYRVRKLYLYDPSYSPRQMDNDMITTINAVPLTAAYRAKNQSYFTKKFLSMSISSMSTFTVTKSAREILFDGYNDGILSLLSQFPGLDVQEKFGMFYGRNFTTQSDVFTMYTKTDENFGRLLSWNYKNSTQFYPDRCGEIRGSAMEFYPLNVKKSPLVFFSSELCKYAELEFVKEVTIKGVLGYKFSGDFIFDNGRRNRENRCFCVEECLPPGILDVSKCRKESPTFLSFPHFYAADPYYRSLIEGMKPNASKHQLFIVIEPKSGIIMDIAANMQVNMLLQPIEGIALYSNVPRLYIPMFYFSQHLGLQDDLAGKLRMIQSVPDYLNYACIAFTGLGLVLIVWSSYGILAVFSSKKRSHKPRVKVAEELTPIATTNGKVHRNNISL